MPDSRYHKPYGIVGRFFDGLLVCVFRVVNLFVPWHRLGPFKFTRRWLGLANLLALRVELRRDNLHDTDGDLTHPKSGCPFHAGPGGTRKREEDGTLNDLDFPAMGCRSSRFGRNMRTRRAVADEPGLLHPNPLLISQRLMKRETFQPAKTLNLLAGAWIQFQVHDWFGHELHNLDSGQDIRVKQAGDWKSEEMLIPQTLPDPTNAQPLNARWPAYRNKNPQWWDASQVYGESHEETAQLRLDRVPGTAPGILCPRGRLYLDSSGFLPRSKDGKQVLSGFTDNWWLGLELLHTLFAKEHNAICERLHATNPQLTDQELFETARLVNCAVMAKIHTVEWTPGILGHPAIQPALDANWMGLIGHFLGEGAARKAAAMLPNGFIKDVFTGVPMSEPDHHGAPYSLTEEFNAVYRLHPLIPDEVPIHDFQSGALRRSYPMIDIAFGRSRTPFIDDAAKASMTDALYSFGVAHPGAITIRNYPSFLRELKLPADPKTGREQILDLAAVDILRDRERGVPRYNEFRRQLRMEPARDWLAMAGGRHDIADELKTLYNDKLEDVDTMVGMFCEQLPDGFGFSDTAFRIFILMASRRLKSDRFFTADYTEEFYTRTGLEWIRATGMKEVVLRHHPELKFAFAPGKNPFAPWRAAAAH